MTLYRATSPFQYGPHRIQPGEVLDFDPIAAGMMQPWIEPVEPVEPEESSRFLNASNCVVTYDSPNTYGTGTVDDDSAYARFEKHIRKMLAANSTPADSSLAAPSQIERLARREK